MHGQWSTYTNMMVTGTAILVLPPEPRVPPSSVHRPNSPTRDTFEKRKETPRQGERTETELAANLLCLLVGNHTPSVARKTTYTAFWEPSVQISSKDKGARWQMWAETIMERRFLLSLRVPCVPFASHCPRSLTNSSCLHIERHSNHSKI